MNLGMSFYFDGYPKFKCYICKIDILVVSRRGGLKKLMNTILKIYKRDIQKIVTNKAFIVIIIGLIIVPALYAWINIIACWDPYGNTKGLSVAIVNSDKGAQFKTSKINVGKEVVDKLKENQNIGWKFVDKNDAESGVKSGKYYASITIPEDFSNNLLSVVLSSEPKKAKLIYSVNEKVNAIAPKITKSGLTSLQNEISTSFTQEASSTVLNYLNAYGLELEKAKPQIQKLMDLMIDIDNNSSKVGQSIDNAYTTAVDLQKYIQNLQGNMPTITDTLNKTIDAVKSGQDFLNKSNDTLKNISPYIRTQLTIIKSNLDTAQANLSSLINSGTLDISSQLKLLQSASSNVSSSISNINSAINMLQSINKILNSNTISNFINNLENIRNQLVQINVTLNNLIDTLQKGNQVSVDAINSLIQSLNKTSQLVSDATNNFDNNVGPTINDLMNNSIAVTSNSLKLLQNTQNSIPLINNLLTDANIGTGLGASQIQGVKNRFPEIQQSLHNNVEKFRNLDKDERLNELTKLLQRNAKSVSDFLSNPIALEQNRVFAIPNYGSAMTPFYTTLAIWVGAFTLLSVLSIKVAPLENNKAVSTREEFFGRYLLFATITIIQALIIASGNLFGLKTYAVSPAIFLIFSIYVGIVFSMIIYTLVSVFGNVGKALALVIMVLQVSASGGTFPIELTPKFFQYISPMLPFTYAIGGMREAEGGIIWLTLYHNIAVLAVYFFLSIIIAIFFKEKLNKKSEKFVNKLKESGLIGE